MVKISIVVPVFNVEKYLRCCFDSLRNQTFSDFEVICIDDGSEDSSLDILQEYNSIDDRFVIYEQSHLGAGEARNQGIKLAKGKYIQFLDSDDYFEPNMLEELYNHAEKYHTDLTVCSSRKVNDIGEIIETGNPNSPINLDKTPLELPFSWRDFKEDIFCLFNVPAWNKLISKELITKNNLLFQNLTSCNDVAFGECIKICAKRIVVFNKELINYRYNRKGSIANFRTKHAENIIYAFDEVKKFLVSNNVFSELEIAFIKALKMHLSWEIVYCDKNQIQKIVQLLTKLMPEYIEILENLVNNNSITLDFFNKIIGDKKVMFWGASLFLQKVLAEENQKNPNILGIIDRNSAYWGKICGNYKIYSPKDLEVLNPDGVILTVFSNNEDIYKSLKEEFQLKYPQIELLPNIFKKENYE